MEFKAVQTAKKEELSTLAQKALDQITDMAHFKDLEARSLKDIVRYGIAFSGKSAVVKISR